MSCYSNAIPFPHAIEADALIIGKFSGMALAGALERGDADAVLAAVDATVDAVDAVDIFPGQDFGNAAAAVDAAVREQVEPIAKACGEVKIVQHHDRGALILRVPV